MELFDRDDFDLDPEQSPSEKTSGWSRREIVVSGVLVLGIIIVGVLFKILIASNSTDTVPQVATLAQPTYTLSPSKTPVPTATPRPTPTLIPGWNQFTFEEDSAEIWLPGSYQGGDTVEYLDIILLILETYVDDEDYIGWVKNYIDENEIVFYGFDNENDDMVLTVDVFIFKEYLPTDVDLTMDEYLNQLMDQLSSGGNRVVDRQVVQLNYYEAGRIYVDTEVKVGDEMVVRGRQAIYSIRIEDAMWSILFTTSKEDFKEYLPTIENSVNTFFVQP